MLSSVSFGYSGGSGTAEDPYQIADANDLLVPAADINMEEQVFTTALVAPDTSSDDFFQGSAFTGTFDGNDHKISRFAINAESDNSFLGLFGFIDSGGVIENLRLENLDVSVTGYDYYSEYVGGLVGYNFAGNIINCYAAGAVHGYCSYVGGLAGANAGSIRQCYSTGAVSGSGSDVGGLVGGNVGSISQCYSTSAVGGSSISYCVGGLAGFTGPGGIISSIINCYATGSVSGGNGVGGLAGWNLDSIINCYSTGSVSGNSGLGGLAGDLYGGGGGVVSSFWDTQTSGQTTSAGGTGKTTAEMKTLLTFTSAGWNFVDVWGIGNGQTYPYLKPFNGINPADLNYSGTVDFADFAILAANWLEED